MKKSLIALAAILIGGTAFSQVQQGALFLSGGLGLSTAGGTMESGGTSVDKPSQSWIMFSPGVGYFLTDNVAAGARLGFSAYKQDNEVTSTVNKENNFGLDVFGRYYGAVNEKFYLYGELAVGFASGKSESESGGTTTEGPKISGFGVNLSPGFTFFPSTRWGLDFSVGLLGLNSVKEEQTTGGTTVEDKDTYFDFGIDGSSINIGVQLFFGGTGSSE